MIDSGPEPAEATAKLDEAERIRDAVRRGGRWYVRYQLLYGTAMFAATLLLGMASAWWSGVVVAVGAFVLGLALWWRAQRQPVAVRARNRCPELNIAAAVSVPLYLAVLAIGFFVVGEQLVGYWLPGAAVVAAPWFVHAYLEARR